MARRFLTMNTVANCTVAASLGYGWWYRPIGDDSEDGSGPKRSEWMSKYSVPEIADERRSELHKLGTQIAITFTGFVARTFLFDLGDCRIRDDVHYRHFLDLVQYRVKSKPLITVSNHRSVIDDPTILSGILPWWMAFQERFNRYSICSQEYLFDPKLPSILQAYGGLGKALPIRRGAGINQKLLLDYARLVAAGEWVHVFPEGGVWQKDTLGGRSDGTEHEKGKLKWGIGKVIAHSPDPPAVVPFFFMGTEHAYPQHPETKALSNKLPRPGCDVDIRFGPEIDFSDLIAEHEKQYGPLWKVKSNVKSEEKGPDGEPVDFHTYWDSKPSDYILYHKITLRVQHALEALNEQYRQDNQQKILEAQLRQELKELQEQLKKRIQERKKLEAPVEQHEQTPAGNDGKKASSDQEPKL